MKHLTKQQVEELRGEGAAKNLGGSAKSLDGKMSKASAWGGVAIPLLLVVPMLFSKAAGFLQVLTISD
jgi:hypothetical protein